MCYFFHKCGQKKDQKDNDESYIALGIPSEWVSVIQKIGYAKVENFKQASAGKLFNDLCGYNKKNKLGLTNPSTDDIKKWLGQ